MRSSTIRELQTNENLLALRSNLGPTAFGFESKHCSDAKEKNSIVEQSNVTNGNKRPLVTEFDEPLFGQSSTANEPKPIRERKRTEFPGSGGCQ